MHAVTTTDAPTEGKRARERTCASCRQKHSVEHLLRLVLSPDGDLVMDWKRNLPGRGAHLCPNTRCVTDAISKKRLDRVFNTQVKYPTPTEFLNGARTSIYKRVTTLLGSSNGARFLAIGKDATMNAVTTGKARCVIGTGDSSSSASVMGAARERGIDVKKLGTKELMGSMLNRRPTGVLAICDRGLADALCRAADLIEALESPL